MTDDLSPQDSPLPEPIQPEVIAEIDQPNQAKLEKAHKQIKSAWILGIVSTVITMLATLVVMLSPNLASQIGFTVWNWLDVFLLAGLTFGIYKKNRICAVMMFAYFLISKVLQFSAGIPNTFALVLAGLFAYVYFEGMRGALTYHNIVKARDEGRA